MGLTALNSAGWLDVQGRLRGGVWDPLVEIFERHRAVKRFPELGDADYIP
jgi:hypothetical protein